MKVQSTLKSVMLVVAVTSFLSTTFTPLALAQNPGRNRQTSDPIFTEPRDSALMQLLYTAGNLIAFQIVRPKLPQGKALTDADQRLLAAANADLPDELKLTKIHEAEVDVANARLAALNTLQERGVIPTVIRYGRVVGTTLILVDIAGRAWVWGALNANPTWSPAVAMLTHLGNGLSTQNALSER